MQLLLDRIGAMAKGAPGRIAVVARDEHLTYEELDRRALALASRLRAGGIGRGSLVASYMDRCADLIVSLLAAMMAGAAYTLVEDEGNSAEELHRLTAMGADAVVTNGPRPQLLSGLPVEVIAVEEAIAATAPVPVPPPTAGDVAYVLFTSGTTGRPKGVPITHANLRHYTESLIQRLSITAPLRYAHVSSLAADLGNTCLFLALWTGGQLHVVDSYTRKDPLALAQYLGSHRIDFLKITPSHWALVLASASQPGGPALEWLVLGGEQLSVQLAGTTLKSGVTRCLVNHYGPTEATIGVAVNLLWDLASLAEVTGTSVPIGTPLGESRLLVRTGAGDYRARAAEGELHIGGPSVAGGYWKDEVATAASFRPDQAEMRLYRTGDRVRIDPAGVIEFLGRVDRQVKIQGYRVEPEQVENVLRQLHGIREAAVLPRTADGATILVAAVTTAHPELDPDHVRSQLAERLPRYMMPSRILVFDAFPLSSNGKLDMRKLRERIDQRMRQDAATVLPPLEGESDDPLVADVVRAWRQHLPPAAFGLDDDFFRLGGNSIDAIQVIAHLQVRGHRVSAGAFLKQPTIRATVAQARGEAGPASRTPAAPRRLRSWVLAPAQRDFFARGHHDPNHWNQAILLESQAEIDPDWLAGAVDELLALHPLLRTRYREGGGSPLAEAIELGSADCCGISKCRSDDVLAISGAIHKEIDIERGRIFRAHLFKLTDGKDQLLLVCHHLSIDGVSWRILIADLIRAYEARGAGLETPVLPPWSGFWEWTKHIHDHAADLEKGLAYWRGMPAGSAARPDDDNREGAAAAVWIGFSPRLTDELSHRLTAELEAPLDVILLAAFTQALCARRPRPHLRVDIESHGRVALSEDLDLSRVVGWFTTTFPVLIQVHPRDLRQTIAATGGALSEVPDLGLGHTLLGDRLDQAPGSEVAYNFLGDWHFGSGERLDLAPSPYRIAPARGDANDRGHDLKLTARIVSGQLVVDLSFSSQRHDPPDMVGLIRDTRRLLLGLLDAEGQEAEPLLEWGSSSGLLAHLPSELRAEPLPAPSRGYRRMLLTGATGYVGAHVLRELLRTTTAEIVCLVRPRPGEGPERRLRESYAWYFPDEPGQPEPDRCSVLSGDIGQPRFGLSATTYQELCASLDAIYHLASDTRLFGRREGSDDHNVAAIETAIQIASSPKPKDLHFMSTLAVCGINPRPEAAIFSEHSLDIGQDFQNDYEQGKFRSEQLMRAFMARGGRGFIYRAGDVTAHSRTGRFQRNAGDNRFVQLLRAVIKVGMLPRTVDERILVCPVDVLARGLVGLSTNARIRPGTFHVDPQLEVRYRDICGAATELGVDLQECRARDFAELFATPSLARDPDVALAYFWISRRPRNIELSCARTWALLASIGIEREPLETTWPHRFLLHLMENGELGDSQAAELAAGEMSHEGSELSRQP